MTVTCDTVRRAFGEFQCCPPSCHEPFFFEPRLKEYTGLCCAALYTLSKNNVSHSAPPTHPALLRAIEEDK